MAAAWSIQKCQHLCEHDRVKADVAAMNGTSLYNINRSMAKICKSVVFSACDGIFSLATCEMYCVVPDLRAECKSDVVVKMYYELMGRITGSPYFIFL